MLSPSVEKLIKIFAKFPTVGPKTASRFAFYLMEDSKEEVENLIQAIEDLKKKIKVCPWCFRAFEPFDSAQDKNNVCEICENPKREKTQVCIVEKEIDLETIEKTGAYKGLYFILGGVLPILKKENAEKVLNERLNALIERIQGKAAFAEATAPKELILALNPTLEGQNTVLWLKRRLEPLGVKITQLAKGMPQGGELEYADEETIASALQGRN